MPSTLFHFIKAREISPDTTRRAGHIARNITTFSALQAFSLSLSWRIREEFAGRYLTSRDKTPGQKQTTR